MQRFLRRAPKREFWPKVWLVHNFSLVRPTILVATA